MLNGILNVYKEKGFTSFDVVAKLRGMTKEKKIGHTGTLDPDAEGVLPICFGKATKVCDMLTNKDKIYETELRLGIVTDTQDLTGTVLKESEITATQEEIIKTIKSFEGEYAQIPPMYSALKVNGQKLCDLARQGIEVERKPRNIHIYAIEILEIQLPVVKMRVECSKGTYIRTLCHDIGEKLKCGGSMQSLVRTKVSIFDIQQSYRFKDIETLICNNTLEQTLLTVDSMFLEYPILTAKKEYDKLIQNGNRMELDYFKETYDKVKDIQFRVYDEQEHFIGIYRYDEEKQNMKPLKIFKE